MGKSMLLMFENTPVMSINLDEYTYDTLCEELLPFTIKGKLRKVLTYEEIKSKYDYMQRNIADSNNYYTILNWLGSRALPLSRKNAKWIYNTLRVEQLNSDTEKSKITIMCRAVSVLDNYWLKF